MTAQVFIAGVILGVPLGAAFVLGLLAALSGHRPRTQRTLPVGTWSAIADVRRTQRTLPVGTWSAIVDARRVIADAQHAHRLPLAHSVPRSGVAPAADTFDHVAA